MQRRRHTSIAAATALAALTAFATPAPAAGLFEALFGAFRRPSPPPATQNYAPDPLTGFLDRLTGNTRGQIAPQQHAGPSRGFCVRTCDGAHFPVQNRPGLSAAEACSSFCPASPTRVFAGGTIDSAVASDGTRYADLDNAFVYRTSLVANCTCNGKASGGLATRDVKDDPTLRPGDIVATGAGLMAYSGKTGDKKSKVANFTPVNLDRVSKRDRERLAGVKIAPATDVADDGDTTASIPASAAEPLRAERQSALDVSDRAPR